MRRIVPPCCASRSKKDDCHPCRTLGHKVSEGCNKPTTESVSRDNGPARSRPADRRGQCGPVRPIESPVTQELGSDPGERPEADFQAPRNARIARSREHRSGTSPCTRWITHPVRYGPRMRSIVRSTDNRSCGFPRKRHKAELSTPFPDSAAKNRQLDTTECHASRCGRGQWEIGSSVRGTLADRVTGIAPYAWGQSLTQ